ncbi:MAG: sulfur carrier protein ThiS [Defluviitaleaceae bacterium]|nr:sulfur carrier protein ThiS [Defluviitaleaceae bacterium]
MRVNGESLKLEVPCTLKAFLEKNGHMMDRVAVELNEKIIPKAEFSSIVLSDADKIEIVSFVGGG